MKTVRILSIVLFFFALAGFIGYEIYNRRIMDYVAPVISADSDSITVSVEASDEELLAGMKAVDNLDGDVTNTLVVASYSKFVKKGTRNVSYAAFDQNNNVGTYTRTLTYSDYRAPRFVMHRPLHFHQNDSHDNVTLAELIQADDVLDGDISPQIIVTSGDRYMFSEDTERMPISVQVSNRAGDTASLDLEVSYLSYTAFNRQSPNLRDYILYTTVGSTPDYRGNILGVRSGTNTVELGDTRFDLYADFEIDTSEADIHTPGAYVVRYHLTSDEAGERQLLGSAEMILVVEEE